MVRMNWRRKIERKKMSVRDENRHLDVKREVNFRMSALIDRYWEHYGSQEEVRRPGEKRSGRHSDASSGNRLFGRLTAPPSDGWYEDLTGGKRSVAGHGRAALQRHAPHDGEGLDDLVEGNRHRPESGGSGGGEAAGRPAGPLPRAEDELRQAESRPWTKRCTAKDGKGINQTFFRLRLIVLIALTTGMRIAEIFGLRWADVMYSEGLMAVRAKLKGGKMRYVPMPPELAGEFRQFPAVIGEDRIFPPKPGANERTAAGGREFRDLLESGRDQGFPLPRSPSHVRVLVHDERRRSLRTGQDPRPLEYQDDRTLRQAGARAHRQDRQHGAGDVEADGRRLAEASERERFECSRIVPATETVCFWLPLSALECGGQGRNRTADASLFRAALPRSDCSTPFTCTRDTTSGRCDPHDPTKFWRVDILNVRSDAERIFADAEHNAPFGLNFRRRHPDNLSGEEFLHSLTVIIARGT